MSVGAAVPQQVPLKQIPTDLASALNGFQGDDYVLVGNQLVIVDAAVRRVVESLQVAPLPDVNGPNVTPWAAAILAEISVLGLNARSNPTRAPRRPGAPLSANCTSGVSSAFPWRRL